MGKIKIETAKDKVVVIVMILCGIYLINPTAGLFELIPDVVPVIGNLDDGAAVTLLISGFTYFGYNLGNLFSNKK